MDEGNKIGSRRTKDWETEKAKRTNGTHKLLPQTGTGTLERTWGPLETLTTCVYRWKVVHGDWSRSGPNNWVRLDRSREFPRWHGSDRVVGERVIDKKQGFSPTPPPLPVSFRKIFSPLFFFYPSISLPLHSTPFTSDLPSPPFFLFLFLSVFTQLVFVFLFHSLPSPDYSVIVSGNFTILWLDDQSRTPNTWSDTVDHSGKGRHPSWHRF